MELSAGLQFVIAQVLGAAVVVVTIWLGNRKASQERAAAAELVRMQLIETAKITAAKAEDDREREERARKWLVEDRREAALARAAIDSQLTTIKLKTEAVNQQLTDLGAGLK